MNRPIVVEYDLKTNETVEREMTDSEYEVYITEQELMTKQKEMEKDLVNAVQKLETLGLTSKDLQALGFIKD